MYRIVEEGRINESDQPYELAPIEIDAFDRAECLDRWKGSFGRPPPEHLSPQFIKRVLIWEPQNRALGGVSVKTARRLKTDRSWQTGADHRKTGLHLVREWNGRTYQVE